MLSSFHQIDGCAAAAKLRHYSERWSRRKKNNNKLISIVALPSSECNFKNALIAYTLISTQCFNFECCAKCTIWYHLNILVFKGNFKSHEKHIYFESARRFFQQKNHKQWVDYECAIWIQPNKHSHTSTYKYFSRVFIHPNPWFFTQFQSFVCLFVRSCFALLFGWFVWYSFNGNSMVKNGFFYIPKCINDGL